MGRAIRLNAVTFDVYGDSHLDDVPSGRGGIGARKALEYELHFRHDVVMRKNKALGGSYVKQWLPDFMASPTFPDVLVVSSGFNEAVAVAMKMVTLQECLDSWKLLIATAKAGGSKVLWIPTQHKFGRAAQEFPLTADFSVAPYCIGADVLEWDPSEVDLCPDRIHHTYEASHRLANLILDKVATYAKDEKDHDEEIPATNGERVPQDIQAKG